MKGKFRKTESIPHLMQGLSYCVFVHGLPYIHYPPSCSLLYCMRSSVLSGCEGLAEPVWTKSLRMFLFSSGYLELSWGEANKASVSSFLLTFV